MYSTWTQLLYREERWWEGRRGGWRGGGEGGREGGRGEGGRGEGGREGGREITDITGSGGIFSYYMYIHVHVPAEEPMNSWELWP